MIETQSLRIDLEGALAGHYVLLAEDELTVGLLEDIQSPRWAATLDSLAACVVGGDLPGGCDRAGLRRLKLAELLAVIKGVDSAFAVPKS